MTHGSTGFVRLQGSCNNALSQTERWLSSVTDCYASDSEMPAYFVSSLAAAFQTATSECDFVQHFHLTFTQDIKFILMCEAVMEDKQHCSLLVQCIWELPN